jgi:hypothetical protein
LRANDLLRRLREERAAFTVASFAMIMHGTPETLPIPITTPAAVIFPHCAYIPFAAQSPISKKEAPGSISCAMRSRAKSRPSLCCRSWPALPPPSRSTASSWAMASQRSRNGFFAGAETARDMSGRLIRADTRIKP